MDLAFEEPFTEQSDSKLDISQRRKYMISDPKMKVLKNDDSDTDSDDSGEINNDSLKDSIATLERSKSEEIKI